MDTLTSSDFLAQYSSEDLKRELDPEHAAPPAAQKVTTKLPAWGWVVILLGALLVVAAAIVLPIVLLRHKAQVSPSVSPVTPTPTTPVRPIFPALAAAALLFQTAVPPTDGLTKALYQVTSTSSDHNTVGFLAGGITTQSAFYTVDLATGVVSAPSVLVSPGSTTQYANAYGEWLLTTTNGTTWSKCRGDLVTATAPCTAVTWPSSTSLQPQSFAGTQWTGQPTDIVFSFEALNHITMQNEDVLVCTNAQALPSGQQPSARILSTFYSVGQTFALFGVANGSSNTINYVVYTNLNLPDCNTLYTLDPHFTAETLLWADMTYDGLHLLVLTSERLMMYEHATPTAPFVLQDVVNLDSSLTTSQCAVDRQGTAPNELWCYVATSAQYALMVPFNPNTHKFTVNQGRQVPSPAAFLDTLGPGAIHLLPATNRLWLVQSDTTGQAASSVIDVAHI